MLCACLRSPGRGFFGCRACAASAGAEGDARSPHTVPWSYVASAMEHGSPQKMPSAAAERRMGQIHASDHRVTTEDVARGSGMV